MRFVFVNFAAAPVYFLLVLLFLIPAGGGSVASSALIAAVGVLALAAQRVVVARRPLKLGSAGQLAISYRSRFFARVAFAQLPIFIGFVATFLVVVSPIPYLIALPFTCVAFALAAPTAARIARDQEWIRMQGSGLSLLAALDEPPPPRS